MASRLEGRLNGSLDDHVARFAAHAYKQGARYEIAWADEQVRIDVLSDTRYLPQASVMFEYSGDNTTFIASLYDDNPVIRSYVRSQEPDDLVEYRTIGNERYRILYPPV